LNKIDTKIVLLSKTIKNLENLRDEYKISMNKAQEEANNHIGAMQSRYDTFKEEAQMLEAGFRSRFEDINGKLALAYSYEKELKKNKIIDKISIFGSVIKTIDTDKKVENNYFIFVNSDTIILNRQSFYIISLDAPISRLLLDKEEGDEFTFNNQNFEIKEIF
jgi:transcription elongation GreA/GreB family factor